MDDTRFLPRHSGIKVAALAEHIGAELSFQDDGDERIVTGAAPMSRAGEQDLCVFRPEDGTDQLATLQAAAIVCPATVAPMVPADCAALVSETPAHAFTAALRLLYADAGRSPRTRERPSVPQQAHVHAGAVLEDGQVSVAAGAVIAEGAHIGADTDIGPGAVIGPGCRIGRHCVLSAHVSVHNALIGNGVFLHAGVRIGEGAHHYVEMAEQSLKVPQIGRVIVQDKVEIGANAAIDRGTLDDTVIGDTTKIGNLVSIGRDVRIGRACIIASHADIATGVSVADHATIRAHARIAGDVDAGAVQDDAT